MHDSIKLTSAQAVIIENVTVQCSERGEAVHLVLILDKLKNAATACVQLQCCRPAADLQRPGAIKLSM